MGICTYCGALFVPNFCGRPKIYCSRRCGSAAATARNRDQRKYVKTAKCATCDTTIRISNTGRAPGVAQCWECWSSRPSGRKVKQLKRRTDCCRCGSVIPAGRLKYCSAECLTAAQIAAGHGFSRAKPRSTRARGYGTEHQALRAQLLPLAYGQNCHLCGDAMEQGQDLHLDHNEDRTGYRGMVHAACNRRDGARRGCERQRQQRLREGWRLGQEASARRRPAPLTV